MSYRLIGIEPTEISPNPSLEDIERLEAVMNATFLHYGLTRNYRVAVEYGASMYYDQPSNHPDHALLRNALTEGWRRFRSSAQPARKRA